MSKAVVWVLGVAAMALVVSTMPAPAEAKRLGGGTSFGQRAPTSTPREALPRQTGTQPTSPQKSAQQTTPAQGTSAAAGAASRPGMGMLGGLAAGLGLAALFTALGFGESMAAVLGNLLLILGMVALGLLMWRLVRGGSAAALATAGTPRGREAAPAAPADLAALRRAARERAPSQGYEHEALAPEAAVTFEGTPQKVPSGVAGRGGVPEGFDTTGFLQGCKQNFVRLQAAWDAADLDALRLMMTDDMLGHIRAQLEERGSQPNRTDVLMLQADLIVIEDLGPAYLASVEFSGMIREEVTAGATPFREIWNLTKPKDGSSGWLLAGVQALQ